MASSAQAALEFDESNTSAGTYQTDTSGSIVGPETQAGAIPDLGATTFTFEQHFPPHPLVSIFVTRIPTGNLKDIVVDLPPGVVGNLNAVTQCPRSAFGRGIEEQVKLCPPSSQVGTAALDIGRGGFTEAAATPPNYTVSGVYSLVPRRGDLAEFGFAIDGVPVKIIASLRPDDHGVRMVSYGANTRFPVNAVNVSLWGVPASSQYDSVRKRYQPGQAEPTFPSSTSDDNPSGLEEKWFLRNPTSCDGTEPATLFTANSWETPGEWVSATALSPELTGCEALAFNPTVAVSPDNEKAGGASGLDVSIDLPHSDVPDGLATADMKKVSVELPEGMSVNPAVADGLAACTNRQLGLGTDRPLACPGDSKVASVQATSPALAESLSGGLFVRPQNSDDPASGEMYRLALVLENAERGISVRLPGQLKADPESGQLNAVFDDNPQLPVSHVGLQLKSGSRAPLTLPRECGEHDIVTTVESWAGQSSRQVSSFDVDCDGDGTFAPEFAAGVSDPTAGQETSFAMMLSRGEQMQEFKDIADIQLPQGLLGNVGSVAKCAIDRAQVGDCTEASRIGRVAVAAGAGSPVWLPQAGKPATSVSLTGPYKGAPYGLAINVPAQAGPFNLGSVVVMTALHVDRVTAQITTGIEESRLIDLDGKVTEVLPGALPRMLKGVLLNQREIRVVVDREGFMINPTNCTGQQISATVAGYGGATEAVSSRFRASDCASLDFGPRTVLRMFGKRFTRSSHPPFRAAVIGRDGDANIARSVVALPRSVMLDQGNIRTVCTRPQWAADECPEAAIYGRAVAWSPVLDQPLRGPVYLRSSDNLLPDLVADLKGPVRLELAGRIDSVRGQMRTSFEQVPDAPVSRFVLQMQGGNQKGLLVANTNLCNGAQRANVRMLGQNGSRANTRNRLHIKRCKQINRRKAAKRQVAKRKLARQQAVRNRAARR